jgi:ribosomal protein S18 acetylase RimI-like enzyme
VRLPLDLDEALAFSARHPVGDLDEPLRRRLLTTLTSSPAGTIVLADASGALVLVATVVDVRADPTAAAQLVVLGATPDLPGATFVGEVLAPARAFARAVGRPALHLDLPEFVRDVDEVLARAGFALAYETCAMRRSHARLEAPEPALSSGWCWTPLDDALVEAAHAALAEIFRGAPSLTLPPLDAFRAGAFAATPGWQLLFDGEVLAGLVRLSAAGGSGEVRVLGRSPAYRGRGLGRVLLDRGLRLLGAAGAGAVTLDVASTNERALDLYRAFDFEVVTRTPVYETLL